MKKLLNPYREPEIEEYKEFIDVEKIDSQYNGDRFFQWLCLYRLCPTVNITNTTSVPDVSIDTTAGTTTINK